MSAFHATDRYQNRYGSPTAHVPPEIASIPGIDLTVKGVESVIYRLTLYVKEELVAEETSKT